MQDENYRKLEKAYAQTIREGAQAEQPSVFRKTIWICWLQGMENAPELVKACVRSVRENLSDHEIVILTRENIAQYVHLPDYIEKKYAAGIISHAHYTDILRMELLCVYGGIWMDATVLCTDGDFIRKIETLPLFVYKRMDLTRADRHPTIGPNWLISAASSQPILLLTRKLLYEYWKKQNYILDYFLFHLFFALAARRYPQELEKIPAYDNHPAQILQFESGDVFSEKRWNQIVEMSGIHKLSIHEKYPTGQNLMNDHILKIYG